MKRAIIVLVFVVAGVMYGYSQKPKTVEITGTVYISSSHSSGVLGGKGGSTPAHAFPNQPIYFIKGNDTTITTTTGDGVFKLKLVPGTYGVFQDGDIMNKGKKGMMNYGSSYIEVTEKNEPFKLEWNNYSSRRSTMSEMNKGMPGAKQGTKRKQGSESVIRPKQTDTTTLKKK